MNDRNADLDAQYARGEISREEWMRQRTSDASRPPPSAPTTSSRPLGSSGIAGRTLFVIVVVIVGIAVTAAFLWSLAGPSAPGTKPTYLQPRQIQASDFSALNASATQGLAFKDNNTLRFSPGSVALVVYASPPTRDLAFVVQGMVNPAIHVAPGTRVTVTVVNMDLDMYHNWALSTQGPPYNSMPMMGGGGMMGGGTMMTMTMLGPASGGGYWSQEMAFTASAGSYWYLCEYPDHANEGMYGSFIVG